MHSKTNIILAVAMLFIANIATAEHRWKEFGYYGGYVGVANDADNNEDNYFAGATAFFHNQLVHDHPRVSIGHVSDWGVVGLASYYVDPESNLSITAQVSRGLWLDRTALLQFSAGPSWSDTYA